MQSSFIRRTLPRSIIALVITAVGVFLSSGGGSVTAAGPGTFSASTPITAITSKATGANPDITTVLTIPSPDYNFSAVVNGTPGAAFVAPGPNNPGFVGLTHPALGDVTGTISSDTHLGLTNNPCGGVPLTVTFVFLNATTDITDVIQPVPQPATNSGDGGVNNNQWTDNGAASGVTSPSDAPWTTAGGWADPGATIPALTAGEQTDGLPAQVNDYPAYLNDIFTPDGGSPVQPLARYAGATNVSGTVVVLNLVVFAPNQLADAFPRPHPFSDLRDVGYTQIAVLQNPNAEAAPGSITDFCSGLITTGINFGTAKTNPCNGSVAPPCNSSSGISNPAPGVGTKVRYANPAAAGTDWFVSFHQSLRDYDNDGKENALDTCATNNESYNPRVAAGPASGGKSDTTLDPDGDGIVQTGGGGCDSVIPPAQTDIDDQDGDGWANMGDNCPIVSNATNTESELTTAYTTAAPRGGPRNDSIGDACDPATTVANGTFLTTMDTFAVCFGNTDADGDGYCSTGAAAIIDPDDANSAKTPESYALVYTMGLAHSGSGLAAAGASFAPPMKDNAIGTAIAGSGGSRQPFQVCSDGIDNDGDTVVDIRDHGNSTGVPANVAGQNTQNCKPTGVQAVPAFPTCPALGCLNDTDGDGFSDEAEVRLGTDALGRCGVGSTPAGPSNDWPADLISGGIPNSTDRVNLGDLTSFLAPIRRLDTNPGNTTTDGSATTEFNARWDLVPGGTFPNWIAVNDLTSLFAGSTGFPAMFSGLKAFGDATKVCSAHPTYGTAAGSD